jgi:perosamine synthetase
MTKKNKNKFLPVTGPWITEKEVKYVTKAAKDGWNENATKYVALFEQKFAKYVGRKYALATSSATGALHLSYLSLGIKKDDEVIAPNITWIASVEPLYWIGAKLKYADIDPQTWCIDPKNIEKLITAKTKAILVVNLYGHVADMEPIMALAKKHNLKVIEDAAESVGSTYKGKLAGSFGDASVFSFHGSKTLTTGEGGMLLTDDEEVIKKAPYYNDHCKDSKKLFWNLEIGYKYKMSNFQATCGLAQLSRVKQLVAKKIKIFKWYKKYLGDIKGITLNYETPGTKNTYWMVTVVINKKILENKTKEQLINEFAKENIQVRPFFYPLSSLPAISAEADTPVAFDISPRAINLPCGLMITEEEVVRVCKVLKNILRL